MFLFLPLTCVYYPVSVLPDWLQIFAWMLPPTYVFEGMRALLVDKVFRADLMIQALALNAVVFAGSTIAFLVLLKSARTPWHSAAGRRLIPGKFADGIRC